jgi:hypothetical protein
MVLNNDFTGGYFSILLSLTISIFAAHIISLNKFIEIFVKVMLFLSLYSIVIYLLRPFFFNYRNLFPHFVNESSTPFLHLGFSVFVDLPNYYRMFGIFRESGVYQIFLNIALYFVLFDKEFKSKIIYTLPILVTIILTFSTPGYIGSFFLILAFIFTNFKLVRISTLSYKTFQFLLFIVIIIVITSILNSDLFESFSITLSKFFNQESSYDERTTSILVDLELWLKKPFFGYGITVGISQAKTLGSALLGYPMSNTSTFTSLMVTMGIFFAFFIAILYVRFFRDSKSPLISNLFIFLAIGLILSSQLIMYNSFFYSLAFFSILKKQ